MKRLFFSLLLFTVLILGNGSPAVARMLHGKPAVSTPIVEVLDREGRPVEAITDGDLIRLQLRMEGPVWLPQWVTFRLDTGGSEAEGVEIGACRVLPGGQGCQSRAFRAWGWYWDAGGTAKPLRTLSAWSQPWGEKGFRLAGRGAVQVAPRPVVMVHGFSSSAEAWSRYTGPQGYLASQGLAGYAVGDGQAEGVMNTGSLADPTLQTNTIAENAAIVGQYITQVKADTGAQSVDLVAHSMGGLISRYYIGRVMEEQDVAQLIMLGSPMAGSSCINLPAALGYYLPAVLEIRPSYVQGIFNNQVTDRRNVPFFGLAGVSIQNPVGSPCTPAPSDLVISRESVTAIPLHFAETPLLHTDLNTSQQVFNEFVLPRLQAPAGSFEAGTALPAASPAPDEMQFTRLVTGQVEPGQTEELTIQIDPGVAVASFALFDPTRSITVTVQGASGNIIPLDPVKNGLVVVDDPASLVHLGYGFANPKPGPWVITLNATERTPAEGAEYAISAHLEGGAVLDAQTSLIFPNVDQAVTLTAEMLAGGETVQLSSAAAQIRGPDGSLEKIDLTPQEGRLSAVWKPSKIGLYAIDILATGQGADGTLLERSAFLSVEAQPPVRTLWIYASLAILGAGLVALLAAPVVWLRRRRKK